MLDKIILIGAGGQGKSCLDVVLATKKYKVLGFLDINKKKKSIVNYRVLGDEKYLNKFNEKSFKLHLSFGFIKSSLKRSNLFNSLRKKKFIFPTIISPLSYVSKNAIILSGTIVHHFALINSGVKIGYNNIINTGSLIEHDVKIGNNCHISTKVIINGGVTIKNNTFIGSNSVIKQGIKIGNNCLIGMGKIIQHDLKNNTIIK